MHDKPKMLIGLDQNGTWLAAPPFAKAHMDRRTTGVQAGPNPFAVMLTKHGKPDAPPTTAGQPQGRLMVQRVRDCGKSERRAVMERIRVKALPGVKASPLPHGLSWQESLRNCEQGEGR